jgi:hypothetical protein
MSPLIYLFFIYIATPTFNVFSFFLASSQNNDNIDKRSVKHSHIPSFRFFSFFWCWFNIDSSSHCVTSTTCSVHPLAMVILIIMKHKSPNVRLFTHLEGTWADFYPSTIFFIFLPITSTKKCDSTNP